MIIASCRIMHVVPLPWMPGALPTNQESRHDTLATATSLCSTRCYYPFSYPSTFLSAYFIRFAFAVGVAFSWLKLLLFYQPLAQHIPIATEMTLFLQADTSSEQRLMLEEQLETEFGQWVEGFEFISRDQALNSLKDNPSWDQALSVLEENPLPDAYVLQLNDQNQAEKSISDLVSSLEAI